MDSDLCLIYLIGIPTSVHNHIQCVVACMVWELNCVKTGSSLTEIENKVGIKSRSDCKMMKFVWIVLLSVLIKCK